MALDFSTILTTADSIRTIPAGRTIFAIGEPGNTMYVLRSGSAQIQVGDLVYETVGANGVVGEMALLDEDVHVRSATAVALTDCSVVEIGRVRLLEIVREQPELGLALSQIVVRRLRATTFLTHHDPVTRLPNRYRFRELCRTALARGQRRGAPVGLLMIDIDHFGSINESLGVAAGDELLRAIAARLGGTLHTLDTVARLGSDNFAALLEELAGTNELVAVAQQVLEAIARPIRIEGRDLYLTASIGISCYPQDGTDPDTLIHAAEFAMRGAIEQGRNTFCFHSAELHRLAVEALELRNQLRRALEREEFHLDYQPRVNVASGRISGLEALLRWRHPELQMIPPSKFIPIAEQTGMIDAIGEWVLRNACAQMQRWLDRGVPPFRLAVNLSVRQLKSIDLPQRIAAILQESRLDPHCLELEVTESTMMEDPARTVFLLKSLRAMGIRVALDDFGTEYSSLGYLKQFPLDYMKIDQSFVRGIPAQEEDAAIAKTVIALAKILKLPVIAEGVESAEQLAFLAEHGCEEYQGYYFARPLPVDDVEALLRSNLAERVS
jgi:diguanylate cyclase (GGDEF)-like protein